MRPPIATSGGDAAHVTTSISYDRREARRECPPGFLDSILESTPKSRYLLIKQEVLNLKCEKAAGMQMYKK